MLIFRYHTQFFGSCSRGKNRDQGEENKPCATAYGAIDFQLNPIRQPIYSRRMNAGGIGGWCGNAFVSVRTHD